MSGASGDAPGTARPEVIILVGLQGAGKSTYYRQHFAETHLQVSKDLMKSARSRETRQQEMLHEALRQGRSVVVDNTNATVEARASIIEVARRYGARLVAIFFDVPPKLAAERNRGREGRARVADAVVYITARKLRRPELAEGFDEIRVVAP